MQRILTNTEEGSKPEYGLEGGLQLCRRPAAVVRSVLRPSYKLAWSKRGQKSRWDYLLTSIRTILALAVPLVSLQHLLTPNSWRSQPTQGTVVHRSAAGASFVSARLSLVIITRLRFPPGAPGLALAEDLAIQYVRAEGGSRLGP